MMNKATQVIKALKLKSSRERAKVSSWFFKTGKGEYGHGDRFIGVTVPDQRRIAKTFETLPVPEIDILLKSKIHEHRLTALFILVLQYIKASAKEKRQIVTYYLSRITYINNWDLVDSSAPYILGNFLFENDRKVLYKLAVSRNLWARRIAIIATQDFIRKNDFADTLNISQMLLSDKEDLLHKAAGWMLREVGKKSPETLRGFLNEHSTHMSRTTLRYAIEKFSSHERQKWLNLK